MSSSLSVLIVTPGVCSLAVGAARPGELLPSCAVSLESRQQGPGFGKGEAEEGEIILQIPQAAGQAGMVSGQVLLWGWAACVSPGGGRGRGSPRLRPAVSLSVGLCWPQFGAAPSAPSPVPRVPSAPLSAAGVGRDGPGCLHLPGLLPRPRARPQPRLIPWGTPSSRAAYPCLPGGPRPRFVPRRVVGGLVALCCCAVGQRNRARLTRPGTGGDLNLWP